LRQTMWTLDREPILQNVESSTLGCVGMRPGHALDTNDGRGSHYLRISPVF